MQIVAAVYCAGVTVEVGAVTDEGDEVSQDLSYQPNNRLPYGRGSDGAGCLRSRGGRRLPAGQFFV